MLSHLLLLSVVAGVHLIPGGFVPGSQPDGNSIVIEAPEGLVVVDTGRHAAHTQEVLDFAKKSGRPIVAVVNTHWHLDHIGGNLLVRRDYPAARIYASGALAGARSGFLANYRKQLETMLADESVDAAQKKAFADELHLIDSADKLAPDVVLTGSGPRTIAGRSFRIAVETHAVTAGDVWLLDEATGILIAGDLVTLPAPFLDTACPSRWQESLERLAKLDFALLIPGHGAPMTPRQFASYREAYADLLTCAATKDDCVSGWIAGVRPLVSGAEFDEKFTRSVAAYYTDVLREDPARLTKLCGD
jgi:glyoxylase-like metal-dependent hydrolase (beta-lactamase superfamily II)